MSRRAFEDVSGADTRRMIDLREEGLRNWHLLIVNTPAHKLLQARMDRAGEYLRALERLYHAARDVSQSRVIVDTSKQREIALGVSRVFSGNLDRFQGGAVKIKSDEEWKSGLSAVRQTAVAALTWPGLLRYAYPLWSSRGEPTSAPQGKNTEGR
jgi:hypothetical protein